MAEKKKTNEQRVFEAGYAAGLNGAQGSVEHAWNFWHAAELERKRLPTVGDRAFQKWTDEGRPPKGIVFEGVHYSFAPKPDESGKFRFTANMLGELGKEDF